MTKESTALEIIKGLMPQKIAEEICAAQPMPSDTFKRLYEAAKPEEELIAEGYVPVDPQTRLMWRKKVTK